MHQTTPALVLGDGRARARGSLLMVGILCSVLAVGVVTLLVDELLAGTATTVRYAGISMPSWTLWALGAVVLGYGALDGFVGWRSTGPDHGFLDQVSEPEGIRLVHRGRLGRTKQLLVQRGQTLTVGATLVYSRRGGLERQYRFTVSAPAGAFTFAETVHVEKLSLAPLDETARLLGIDVVTTGEAEAVARSLAPDVRSA